ncbi:lipid-A-disaccharide synthase [Poseidonocella sedimentorum]|uniref:Lipid-A-disaccharide synthase n=1 Tax=Poseidonocella sedimentorum TaxID=871652 RepID=A0A1I6DEH1_9RHOB|nr:lipid-A-disaccharide synthase [Poseidonocella sedimentorum]SFR03880.1 lipid-A-disaccharide synthase [Poseidonocella sedimentorum]
MSRPLRVFLIAGEPSGDKLGAALMEGLKSLAPGVTFSGVGGPRMEEQGLSSRFPMEELSVMGLTEILPKYLPLRRRMIETADAVISEAPDVLITIDSPEFCLRVARRVKAASDIRTVHYVAPSVWAWRPKRATHMARFIDHVLALLPFEPPYMSAAGMRCDFVGHPVVTDPQASPEESATLSAELGLGDAPTLLLLPGSRGSELKRLLPIFGETVARLLAERPDLRLILPVATPRGLPLVRDAVAGWARAPDLIDPTAPDYAARKRAAFALSDAALAASGTVSLELAAAGTPMVIAYDMSPLSRMILSRMLRIDTVTLVNLVSETRQVPEFIGAACQPDRIAPAVSSLLIAPEPQQEALRLTMERLGRGGEAPGLRAARAVLDGLGR